MKNNKEEIKKFKVSSWNSSQNAETYEKRIYKKRFIATIKNNVEYYYVSKQASGIVLDAGAGTGRFSLPLISNNHIVISCDISLPMLSIAKKKSSHLKCLLTDIYKLPFKEKIFDSIVSITVLEHFPDYSRIITEFSRILKPNGIITFEMPNKRHLDVFKNRKFKIETKNCNEKSYLHYVEFEEIKNILEKNQLKLINYIPYDFFNNNQILKRLLSKRKIYNLFYKILDHLIKIPEFLKFFYLAEIHLLKHLPNSFGVNLIINAKKD